MYLPIGLNMCTLGIGSCLGIQGISWCSANQTLVYCAYVKLLACSIAVMQSFCWFLASESRHSGLPSILYSVTSSWKTITLYLLFKLFPKVSYFWNAVSKTFHAIFLSNRLRIFSCNLSQHPHNLLLKRT